MARNSSGTYSLPAGNPVVTGTVISSAWANTTLSDLATEITNSLDRSGRGGMTAPILVPDGTVAAPAHSFTNETGSGLYRAAAGDIRLAVLGVDRIRFGPNGSAPILTFYSPQAAGGSYTDFQFGTNNTRTTGYIFQIHNNGTSQFIIDASNAATIKGSTADGASAVGVISDTINAFSTAGSKIHSFRTAASERLAVLATGDILRVYGGDFIISTTGTNAQTVLKGNRNATDNEPDIGLYSSVTRSGSIGQLVGIYNNSTKVSAWDYNGYNKLLGSNPSSSTGFTNTLTPSNICKAWALLTCGAGGTVTVTNGFNVASASWSTNQLTVTFGTGMGSTSYDVNPSLETPYLGVASVKIVSTSSRATGSCVIQLTLGSTGASQNWANGDVLSVTVYATQ